MKSLLKQMLSKAMNGMNIIQRVVQILMFQEPLQSQDEFYHPRKCCLLVEGDLLKTDNTRFKAADQITLANNGIVHLFSNLKYELAV